MKINTKLVVLTLVIHNLFTFVLPFIVSESSPSSEGQFSLNDTCNETKAEGDMPLFPWVAYHTCVGAAGKYYPESFNSLLARENLHTI